MLIFSFTHATTLQYIFNFQIYLQLSETDILMILWLSAGGSYIYMEASNPAKPGNKVRLVSPQVSPSNSQHKCMTFYYYMYGRHVAQLNVYVQTGLSFPGNKVWTRQGTKGRKWIKGTVDITSRSVFNVSTMYMYFVFCYQK